jgi:mannonate dehydratase
MRNWRMSWGTPDMRLAFRWFGPDDPIPLAHIAQIPGVHSIVTALYDIPPGEAWPLARLLELKTQVAAAGLSLDVIESIPVHEDIKLGLPTREAWAEKYCASINALGAAGIPVLCYNFMPVFDWVRTDLARVLPDGSTALAYDDATLLEVDPATDSLQLPGWATRYTAADLRKLLQAYRAIDEESLWHNLAWFIDRIVPAAEAANVKLAVHPDDPPWPLLGLPRILTSGAALQRLVELNDSPVNGVTFCTGSLAPAGPAELVAHVRQLGARGRIHFAHCRNVKLRGPRDFHEVAHPSGYGDVDMLGVLRALHASGFRGCIRPDHGRMIWGEAGRPGYGLYDRALGAAYLNGLWEAIERV